MSNDGFSVPDPADVPERLREMDPEDVILHDGSLSCDDCEHQTVCQIYNGFAKMVYGQDGMGDDPAVSPEDLAVVCDEYLPGNGDDEPLATVE